MYAPAKFAVTDSAEIEAVLAGLRLGCLVTHDDAGLAATHMPFLYDRGRRLLTAHMARSNPHWSRGGEGEALAIFQGPNAYVTPSWYQAKRESGRVVPTWNYQAVHVHGRVRWRQDPDWLIAHVSALSDHHEASRPEPWAVGDAPVDYIRGLAGAIVGVELAIERVEVVRKMSQNRSAADQATVIDGLAASDAEGERELAAVMQQVLDAKA